MTIFEQIKSQIHLIDYASKYIRLKNIGDKCVALCPFHSEKTPSFHIDRTKDLFYCFGCQIGGDLFDFYINYHKSTKQEALIALAEFAGIKLNNESKNNDLECIKEFFINNLTEQNIAFLRTRGVNQESIQKFHLGYAPSSLEIMRFIKSNNLNLKQYGFDDYFWKMFERRIVFPIYDHGRLCSFGGRSLDSRAKYINGPSSNYFDKSKILYSSITKYGDVVYIVEGYFDVILMHQHGFNSVAAMGTSFSSKHLANVWNRNDRLIVAMDGDIAGKKSSIKIAHMAFELIKPNKSIDFVFFPQGHDPASFLASDHDLKQLPIMKLYEYIFSVHANFTTNPDLSTLILKKLDQLAEKIQNRTLATEYKRSFKKLHWEFFYSKKRNGPILPFANFITHETLLLLLFKYVLLYPEILDEIQECFVRLKLPDYMRCQLKKLLNKEPFDDAFYRQIMAVGVVEKLANSLEAQEAWYRIFEKIEPFYKKELL